MAYYRTGAAGEHASSYQAELMAPEAALAKLHSVLTENMRSRRAGATGDLQDLATYASGFVVPEQKSLSRERQIKKTLWETGSTKPLRVPRAQPHLPTFGRILG